MWAWLFLIHCLARQVLQHTVRNVSLAPETNLKFQHQVHISGHAVKMATCNQVFLKIILIVNFLPFLGFSDLAISNFSSLTAE
jgi:hypothetical protein